MGTTFQIKYVASDGLKNPTVLKAGVDSVLSEVNRQMSTYIPGSEISQFNRSESTEPIFVSKEFYYVVNRALYWSRKSNGAFDITVFPLLYLWGFGPGQTGMPDQFPDSLSIHRRLSHVDYEKIRTEESSIVKLDPYISIDLNAIAKGFGVDAVFDYLKSQNIYDMMVEIGGEVRVIGRNAQDKIWAIAIEKPKLSADMGKGIDWVIDLNNQAMATSGDYRSYFEIDGNIYSHEIDPRTGYPSRTGVASATVIAPNCTDADALATALMLMPIADGLKLVDSIPKTEAFLMIRQPKNRFTYQQSSGMNARPY